MIVPKDFRPLAKAARKQGWTLATRGSGHISWTAPSGFVHYSESTPSDVRAVRNLRAALRRGGLVV